MAFDAHKNFAVSAVAVAPSPATTGLSLTVTTGEGVRFPAAPFNATVCPVGVLATPANAEILRVTAVTGDVLTITRAQEGSTARAIQIGDLIAATITAKTLADVESGVNFPQIQFPGGGVVTVNTTDGADTQYLQLVGASTANPTRSAYINLFGNEFGSGLGGALQLFAGNVATGTIHFLLNTIARGMMHASGGFSWGNTVDPGAPGLLSATAAFLAPYFVSNAPANDGSTFFCGGKDSATGGYLRIFGNASATNPGAFQFIAGGGASGFLGFYTNGGANERGRMHASGGFSWATVFDPGSNAFQIGGTGQGAGNAYCFLHASGQMQIGTAGTGAANVALFYNNNGAVGIIQTSGTSTAYLTSSDARLKRDRGRHTDPEVLRKTVVHSFDWKADGLPGRGVFAQEAHAVAPFAVSVGTDERDDEGRLKQPWGVDYSKYVPDLIVGWQQHDDTVTALEAQVKDLRAELAAIVTFVHAPPQRPTLFATVRDWLRGLLAKPPLVPVKA